MIVITIEDTDTDIDAPPLGDVIIRVKPLGRQKFDRYYVDDERVPERVAQVVEYVRGPDPDFEVKHD